MFKFVEKDNKFSWEDNEVKIEFSEPTIETRKNYETIKSEKDIIYYYYTLKIFKKIEIEKNDSSYYRWQLVNSISTFDFPNIMCLVDIIEKIISISPKKDGQKERLRDNNTRYSYTLSTEGFAYEDFYSITKINISEDKTEKESYSLYIATALDKTQPDFNTCGIKLEYVTENELKELLKCAKSFIEFSIKIHNSKVVEYNKLLLSNKEIKNDKLYVYKIENTDLQESSYEKDIINKNELDYIFAKGDIIDAYILKDNKQNSYKNVEIINIQEEKIIVKDNYSNSLQDIFINELIDIFNQITEENKHKLFFNQQEIADEFLSILNKQEINEIKKMSNEEIFIKYKDAIVNRTHICREEHNFNINKDGSGIKRAYAIVKGIINIIKTKI